MAINPLQRPVPKQVLDNLAYEMAGGYELDRRQWICRVLHDRADAIYKKMDELAKSRPEVIYVNQELMNDLCWLAKENGIPRDQSNMHYKGIPVKTECDTEENRVTVEEFIAKLRQTEKLIREIKKEREYFWNLTMSAGKADEMEQACESFLDAIDSFRNPPA